MYLKIVCLSELNRNHFYLLPLRLLLLPLNKNCFSNIVGFCVYIINTIIHGCLEIWNFSSRVQFDISLLRYAHSWDIALNTRREIPYLRAPMYIARGSFKKKFEIYSVLVEDQFYCIFISAISQLLVSGYSALVLTG